MFLPTAGVFDGIGAHVCSPDNADGYNLFPLEVSRNGSAMSRSSTFLTLLLFAWMPVVSSWAQVAADQGAPPPPPEAVVAGELLTEMPTLLNLGFEWFIRGIPTAMRSWQSRIGPGDRLPGPRPR